MYLYTRFPFPCMSSLPEKFPIGRQIRYDLEDLKAISENPLGLLWLYEEDPEDTSLAAAREEADYIAEMKEQAAEEYKKDCAFWAKDWNDRFKLDQLFEDLQDVMSKCKDLREQLTHETRQAVKEQLQAELEYWTSQVEGFREALKNFDRDEGEDDGEYY